MADKEFNMQSKRLNGDDLQWRSIKLRKNNTYSIVNCSIGFHASFTSVAPIRIWYLERAEYSKSFPCTVLLVGPIAAVKHFC